MTTFSFDQINRYGGCIAGKYIKLAKDNSSILTEPHTHSYLEISYVSQGHGIQLVNGNSIAVKPGTALFLKENDVHTYFSLSQDVPLTVVSCCFLPEHSHYGAAWNAIGQLYQLEGDSLIEFEMLLFLLEKELLLNRPDCEKAADMYLSLLLQCLLRYSKHTNISENRWDILMSYIADNAAVVTLDEAAKIMGFSTGYFCRAFKRAYHLTFHQFLDNLRLQTAKELIVNTDMAIADIAAKAGYSHVTRLYREFKCKEGMTPQKYRQSREADNAPLISQYLSVIQGLAQNAVDGKQ